MNKVKIETLIRELLVELGEDPNREGLKDTPARVARFWAEFIGHDPGNYTTSFPVKQQTDQIVVVGPMRVWSLCEHHMIPFYSDITVGYIPGSSILGLSKFARIAHMHAHKLQVQERMIESIANEISTVTGTEDVAVIGYGEHLCMTMRGVRTPSKMVSSVMHGAFRSDSAARREFFDLSRTLHAG